MKSSFIKCILWTSMLFSASIANAQDRKDSYNKHHIKIGYSDGLTLGGASFWGMGLSDAITGAKRTDEQSTGVLGLGYRYAFNKKVKVGVDLGFAKVTSKVTYSPDKSPTIKEKELNFIILPTVEFIYFRRELFQLYGSVSAGVDLTRYIATSLTENVKAPNQKHSNFETEFAYQINPIGFRIGNSKIGGFIETGLGYKGFVTAGISLGF